MDASAIAIRSADVKDIEALRDLDTRVFADGGLVMEPAAPSEIESGIRSGVVLLAHRGERLIGFVHLERVDEDLWFLASLAVERRERRHGVGSRLLDEVLKAQTVGCANVTTVTSWENTAMMRLLLRHGFSATDYYTDYYGPGKDRIVLDRHRDRLIRNIVDRRVMPASSVDHWRTLLSSDDWVIQDVPVVAGRPYVELVRVTVSDRESLKADEAHAGMGFAGAVIAALTFLFGFSITSTRFTDDVRVLLALSVVASLWAMVVYANAFGELARLRSQHFVRRMEVGNIVSEYGGIVPLFIVIPTATMAVVASQIAVWVLGVVGTAVLAVFSASRTSLWSRYRRRWWSIVFSLIIAAAPALWILVSEGVLASTAWTLLVVFALTGAAVDLYLAPEGEGDGC